MRCIYVDVNIALKKAVSMSSRWSLHSGLASVAVDGNRRGRFAMTRYEIRAWVKIDLLKEVLFLFVLAKVNCAIYV